MQRSLPTCCFRGGWEAAALVRLTSAAACHVSLHLTWGCEICSRFGCGFAILLSRSDLLVTVSPPQPESKACFSQSKVAFGFKGKLQERTNVKSAGQQETQHDSLCILVRQSTSGSRQGDHRSFHGASTLQTKGRLLSVT